MVDELAFSIVTTNQRWLADVLDELDTTAFEALYVVDHPAFPIPDPWTWLAWAAGRTRRIRLGTHVTGAPFHHPWRLANQIATVDRLSGGRVTLGIGTAYERQDFEPYGFPMPDFHERAGMLEESLRILRRLWTGERIEFKGLYHQLAGGATLEPGPVQRPHPPVIVGLNRQGRLLRIAAEQADGINTWQLGPAQIAELRPHVEAACQRAGRSTDALRLTSDVLLARDADRAGAQALAEMVSRMARSWGRDERVTDWNASGILYGDADAMAEQVLRFGEVGVSELSATFDRIDDVLWFDESVIARVSKQTRARQKREGV